MNDPYAPLLFDDDVPPERLEALRAALHEDPALAQALHGWRALAGALRQRLDAAVPDRGLLVLAALDDAGRADDLTPAEQAALQAARPELRAALASHPALRDVVRDVAARCDDFDACWMAHFLTPSDASRTGRRADRAAVPRTRTGLRWGFRVGVGTALLLFAVLTVFIIRRDAGQVTTTAPVGGMEQLVLADGTTVRLYDGAALTYVGEAARFGRRVELAGRAFFDVASRAEGFFVETATARTTVLGTRFGIVADDRMTEVVLASGRLALAPRAAPDRMVVLEPGQMSRVAASALPSTPVAVNLTDALAWTGTFVFVDTPLADIAERLAAHYGVPVAVHEVLRAEAVTGTFEQEQPLREILETIAATLAAEVRPTADGGFVMGPRREE